MKPSHLGPGGEARMVDVSGKAVTARRAVATATVRMRPETLATLLDAGADGVLVSNHGGRQVDGAVGALDALPRVVDAAGGALTVLFDSGIRTGADVMKALCLGAAAVLVGRPFAYGLAIDGEAGVRHVLRCLLADFDLTMALSGRVSLAELSREVLVPA